MRRVHAEPNVALVQDVQARTNRPVRDLPRHPMSENVLTTSIETAVAAALSLARPKPARTRPIDERPKARLDRHERAAMVVPTHKFARDESAATTPTGVHCFAASCALVPFAAACKPSCPCPRFSCAAALTSATDTLPFSGSGLSMYSDHVELPSAMLL